MKVSHILDLTRFQVGVKNFPLFFVSPIKQMLGNGGRVRHRLSFCETTSQWCYMKFICRSRRYIMSGCLATVYIDARFCHVAK